MKKEMEENLDAAVDDELERERKAAEEDEYGEEEKSQPTDGRRYRGRGGGRFGGGDRDRKYGDNSPPAKPKDDGGYFGKKFGTKKPKGEFEGSDDDEEDTYKSAYDKPSRGGGQVAGGRGGKGGKKGKNAMAMNDSDFPTL